MLEFEILRGARWHLDVFSVSEAADLGVGCWGPFKRFV